MTISSDDNKDSCSTCSFPCSYDGKCRLNSVCSDPSSIEGNRDEYALSELSSRSVCKKRNITPVFNGRVLDIKDELICTALSGISYKHYDGSCLRPKEEHTDELDEYMGEGYFLDFDESEFNPEEEKGNSMDSMIKLCYIPQNRGFNLENPEMGSDYDGKPMCVQERINYRNSFWDLHRPELCKLTWPYEYVAEATVTEHLHKHLLKHGPLCATFHEQKDMTMMFNNELDVYDQLKVLQRPREIPPDEDQSRKKSDPCKYRRGNTRSINFKDEKDVDQNQRLHASKEEFCITIGRPTRQPILQESEGTESEECAFWITYGEHEADGDYYYPDVWDNAEEIGSIEGQMEEGGIEDCEDSEKSESVQGWVEPDYCAMV